MKKSLIIIPLLATMTFPLLCGGKEVSAETRAYERAVAFIEGTRQAYITNHANALAARPGKPAPKYIEGPSEAIWDKNLVVLARSPFQEGDKYLARLVFFIVDAGGGEDFACATWYRGKHHRNEFLKHMREARDNYESMSPCLAPKFEEEKSNPVLQCIAKDSYAKLVEMQEAPESKEGNAEAAADCSHMFKLKKTKHQ